MIFCFAHSFGECIIFVNKTNIVIDVGAVKVLRSITCKPYDLLCDFSDTICMRLRCRSHRNVLRDAAHECIRYVCLYVSWLTYLLPVCEFWLFSMNASIPIWIDFFNGLTGIDGFLLIGFNLHLINEQKLLNNWPVQCNVAGDFGQINW